MKTLIIILLFLVGTTASSQIPICSPPPNKTYTQMTEKIPDNAVEPVYSSAQPYCPRTEYELKWFVVEQTEYSITGYEYFTNRQYLAFKPMCILKINNRK